MTEAKREVWGRISPSGEILEVYAYDADAVEFRPPDAVRFVPASSAREPAAVDRAALDALLTWASVPENTVYRIGETYFANEGGLPLLSADDPAELVTALEQRTGDMALAARCSQCGDLFTDETVTGCMSCAGRRKAEAAAPQCGYLITDGQTTIGACEREPGHDGEHQRGKPAEAAVPTGEQLWRCKRRKAPGDGGVVDGCGWQGRPVSVQEAPGVGSTVPACPDCGSIFLRPVEHPQPAVAGGEWVSVRPVVRWFAEQIELALRRNDHKGGWHECDPIQLERRVREESLELRDALRNYGPPNCGCREAGCPHVRMFVPGPEGIIREAADTGAMAMMVADHFREGGPSFDQGHDLLPPPPSEPEGG